MNMTFKFFFACFFCFALTLLSGCGGGLFTAVPKLTPAEKEKADQILADNGKNAILHYLQNPGGNPDQDAVLKYIKYFVSQGADVNARRERHLGIHDTPLYVAAQRRYLQVCRFLVSKGADLNVRDDYGRTLLHLAVDDVYTLGEGSLFAVEVLMNVGADSNVKDNTGKTPRERAIEANKSYRNEYLGAIISHPDLK